MIPRRNPCCSVRNPCPVHARHVRRRRPNPCDGPARHGYGFTEGGCAPRVPYRRPLAENPRSPRPPLLCPDCEDGWHGCRSALCECRACNGRKFAKKRSSSPYAKKRKHPKKAKNPKKRKATKRPVKAKSTKKKSTKKKAAKPKQVKRRADRPIRRSKKKYKTAASAWNSTGLPSKARGKSAHTASYWQWYLKPGKYRIKE